MRERSFEALSEERLIPTIRARLAKRLYGQGFHVKEIAFGLNVTQAAVTQYIKGRRGGRVQQSLNPDELTGPLAETLAKRIRSGLGGIETVELLETARELVTLNTGRKVIQEIPREPERNESLELLRERLKLELSAAENYLELANKTSDDYSKLLLRMIASDSIRHGDVVSQIISWLEAEKARFEIPEESVLEKMLSTEDSAHEVSLRDSVKVSHPIARLLLEWIDIDEGKHAKIVAGVLALSRQRRKTAGRRPG